MADKYFLRFHIYQLGFKLYFQTLENYGCKLKLWLKRKQKIVFNLSATTYICILGSRLRF